MVRDITRSRYQLLQFIACIGLVIATGGTTLAQPRGQGGTPPDAGRPRGDDPTDEGASRARLNEKAQKLLSEGELFLAKGDIRRAKLRFRSVIELVGLEGAGQGAYGALQQLHQRGQQELEAAQTAFKEGRHLEALQAARSVKNNYANLFGGIQGVPQLPNLATLAARLITKIEADPGAKAALQEDKARPMARRIERLEKAGRKDRSKLLDLYDACAKLARKYPDSPSGRKARDRAQSLKADRKTWKLIGRERDRRDLVERLRAIDEHEKAGRLAEATKELDKLRVKYPGKSREDLVRLSQQRVK